MANERITVVGATLGNSVYTLEIIVAIITDVGKIYILLWSQYFVESKQQDGGRANFLPLGLTALSNDS